MSGIADTIDIFELSDPTSLRGIDDVKRQLVQHGQCIVRGAIDPEAIRQSVASLRARFSQADDVRQSLPFAYGQTPNYQRLDVGTYGGDVYLFCRTFLIFPWNDDRLALVHPLVTIARVKNALHGLPETYGLRGDEPVFYGLIIHQYPRGGGFMSGHRHAIDQDSDPGMQRGAFARHYTVGLVMSEIGKDFAAGGGWSMVHGSRLSWEHSAQPGDLVIYDDGLLHGCNTVDIFAPLDLGSLNGRLFGLVSPFSPENRFTGGDQTGIVQAKAIVQRLA